MRRHANMRRRSALNLHIERCVYQPASSSSINFPLTAFTSAHLLLIALALTHFFAGKLRFLDVVPRSRWLSIAGGISVAYAFLHLIAAVAGQL